MKFVKTIGDVEYEREVVNGKGLVLVDFWASWCPPCRALGPVLDHLAERYHDRLKVFKVNVDRDRLWADRLRVQGIPALFFYRGGKVVDQISGFLPEEVLAERIERLASAA